MNHHGGTIPDGDNASNRHARKIKTLIEELHKQAKLIVQCLPLHERPRSPLLTLTEEGELPKHKKWEMLDSVQALLAHLITLVEFYRCHRVPFSWDHPALTTMKLDSGIYQA